MNKDYFCMAPFRKMMEFPSGTMSTCCHYPRLKKSYNTIEDAFYGEEMQNLREKMINGEFLEGCRVCRLHEKNPGHFTFKSQRFQYNSSHGAQEYLDSNKPPEPILKDLELAYDDKCNYMCVICGPKVSSAWQKRIGDDIGPSGFPLSDSSEWPPRTNQNSLLIPTATEIEKYASKLKFLLLTGGEPTIQKNFNDEFYDKLEKKCNDDMLFSMITNGSRFVGPRAIEFMKKRKKIIIMISLDGIGKVGEWCRYGLKMRVFHKNFVKWLELMKDKTENIVFNNSVIRGGIYVNICIHNYNLFNMRETLEYLHEMGLDNTQYILSFNNSISAYICPSYLPYKIKNYILKNCNFYDSHHENFMINLLNQNSYNQEYCEKFIEYTDYLMKYTEPPEECLIIYDMVKNE